ncbi:MAG TPA: bifunctional demethylmenaquinone methyltransferase/2-methoxy-6-polyprenyl-1,4-benzoquinol methylase UbiE [Candidatus Saccharimonadales bacterium]|nr:bifunctional demethylmenaquinone methyltransferase/2-methoxy-6-polyprenyl-1,4-benzoquinol methylase UbiE [Candidatus Saccharimonadales bacterium]
MSNVFYAPGEQRAAKVNDLFAAIARRYDLLNDLQSFGLHRRWKHRVVQLAAVRPGQRALDVCCGTGDIALALAQFGTEVTGLDFSQAMLQIAETRRQKNQQSSDTNPKFIQGDAQQLPFSDNSFDAITVGYGLRNLASWETGLLEMFRVAKPGARLLVLDFGKPPNRLWRAIYFGHLRCSVPLIGRLFCGNADAYAYILESLKHYPAQQGVAEKMRELGLSNVRVINLLGGAMAINYGEKPP